MRIEHGIDEYLRLRRALGFKLYTHDVTLREFARFIRQQHAKHITTALVLHWATLPARQPGWCSERYRRARLFAQYWSSRDSRTQVPPPGLVRHEYRRPTPRIFTDGEVAKIIRGAANLPMDAMDCRTFACIYGLLAATGLRIGEALALNRDAVDLKTALLHIRETKFMKSRVVPIHRTTCSALAEYARLRNVCPSTASANAFFTFADGRRPTRKQVYCTLQTLARAVGVSPAEGKRHVRLHEFRHTFVVKTLVRWYRSGVNVDAWLPALSTYLGHSCPAATYWYISAVPELLALASGRLARAFRVGMQ